MEIDRDRLRLIGWIAAAIVVGFLALRVLGHGGASPGVTVDAGPAAGGEADAGADSAGADAAGSGPPGSRGQALVQVAGEVRRPGVYRVVAGARVQDAVEQAGGLTRRADPAGVNLVARVADGQQVIVPRRGVAAVAGPAGAAGGGAGGHGAPVSIGSASAEQLDSIDGIGPTLARRIVDYRQQHGGFRSVDELRQVEGIGEKRFQALRKAVAP
jgi:competence protein ComEA